MTKREMVAELARRKVQFHPHDRWDEITLWGLFGWGSVSKWIKKGYLVTHMKKANKTIWATPSKELWETEVKPMIDKYTLEELTKLAGW